MENYGLNASQLAETIGIQRSTLSHILSGRNKPSLDVVQRILMSFPEIQAAWLLNGDGGFDYKSNSGNDHISKRVRIPEIDLFSGQEIETSRVVDPKKPKDAKKPLENIANEGKTTKQERSVETTQVKDEAPALYLKTENAEIERVMIFYSNGTVKAYKML